MDLFLAVAHQGFQRILGCFHEAIQKGTNGFEKLHLLGLAYYQFYKEFPDTFRLLTDVRHVKSKVDFNSNRGEFTEFDNFMFREFVKIIAEGKADGSIRPDLDTTKGAYSIALVTMGLFNMLLSTGKTFAMHFALESKELIYCTLQLLGDAFRATKAQQKIDSKLKQTL